jgi:hypothetical protein
MCEREVNEGNLAKLTSAKAAAQAGQQLQIAG